MSQSEKIKLDAPLTGTIVEWNDEKRYGFVQAGRLRIFLHHRDFAERHKRPAVGDNITFVVGQDPQGRSCAQQAIHVNDGGRITLLNLLVLVALLVLPVLALWRWRVDWRWAVGVSVAISLVAYVTYAQDKQRARKQLWRYSEWDLHLVDLLGGWPGGFLAQRKLRHKCRKFRFQFWFWFTVALYQLIAFDAWQSWRYLRLTSEGASRFVKQLQQRVQGERR